MSQLLKHYWLDRDNGAWATYTKFGLMMPRIEGLEVNYNLTDENEIPFMLSTVPDYFEYTVTTSLEGLQNLQNTAGITIVSSTEIPAPEATEENPNPQPSYEVVYRKNNVLEESVGLQVLTQQEWDNEIASYDSRQETKRYDTLRPIRDELLLVTDWIVIKSQEQSTTLDEDFKTWRQALRDLPSETPFPTGFPTLPVIVENDQKVLSLYSRWSEIAAIPMINDPLIPAP